MEINTKGLREAIYTKGAELTPTKYLLTYRCTRCGHVWSEFSTLVQSETADCRMGCTNPSLWLRLVRMFGVLIAGKDLRESTGYGKLIKSENFPGHVRPKA